MENPFDHPTTIRNPEYFVGREDELKRIIGLMKRRQNVSLVGPKRIGKTSLLNNLRQKTHPRERQSGESEFLFFYLDLQRSSMKTQVDLLDDVLSALREQSQEHPAEEMEKDDEIRALLEEFQQRNLHPILMIDTFDEIVRYKQLDPSVFDFLRSQGLSGKMSYVIASVEEMGEIFRKLWPTNGMISPFYNIFGTVRLSSFSRAEAHWLLAHFSQREGLPFSEQEINWVLERAGQHPFLVQQVAALLFQAKQRHDMDEDCFSRVQKEAQQNLLSHFEDFWSEIDNEKRQRLLKEAQQKNRDGLMYPELSLSVLFRNYLQETGKLKAAPIVDIHDMDPEDFQEILDKVSDLNALGQSPLIGISCIAKQIEQEAATSTLARGRIVQKLLKEALENIGGQGKRSDEAGDWRYYNILYYRYFMLRHDMSQEGIARRLLLSSRQYYRLRPKAVERLWKALLALEGNSD
ncbi:MAG TPA: ATP-binding protein [Ktedonobacteraceae bacterium]|nr:ATP-binding protein [Ktedonobacteraceae bacterium]